MKKKLFVFLALMPLIVVSIYGLREKEAGAASYDLGERLRGRLLLQVEKNGEAWYVHPDEMRRYFLGRPADAFSIMKEKAIGVSNRDFDNLRTRMPENLSGRIIMKAEDKGQAFYVNPSDNKLHFLGRPDDAFKIMRELSTGIKDQDINKIDPVDTVLPAAPAEIVPESSEPAPATDSETDQASREIFKLINNYRTMHGMQEFVWLDVISEVCENFSKDMASGKASFSHDGFSGRIDAVKSQMEVYGAAENIAWNYKYSDPATRAVDQWLNSPGHKKNIDGNYKYTGIGTAISSDGKYYFTQIFIR